MCEVRNYMPGFSHAMRGRSVHELFPAEVMAKVPYESVVPGHCLMCRRPLSHADMFPGGRCSRPMCGSCYQANVASNVGDYRCIMTGLPLDNHQVHAQQLAPREVIYHLAPGYAHDYYMLCANKVLGMDMSFLRDGNAVSPVSAKLGSQRLVRHDDVDVMDAEYWEHGLAQQPVRALPAPQRWIEHQPQEMVEGFLSRFKKRKRELEPVYVDLRNVTVH